MPDDIRDILLTALGMADHFIRIASGHPGWSRLSDG